MAWYRWGLLVSFFLIIVACANKHYAIDPSLQAVRGRLSHDLAGYRVQVTEIGQDVNISIATDELFARHSTVYTDEAVIILNRLQRLLATYQTIEATFTAYTDELCTLASNQALAQARVKQLAHYFWEHGLDARMLHVAANASCGAKTSYTAPFARRIEIQFRAVTV